MLLGVVSDVRDERGDLDDLEEQGARPALLRRVVRLRSLVVVGWGSQEASQPPRSWRTRGRLVAVTADARATDLPLRATVTWPVLAVALGGGALAAAALVTTASRRMSAAVDIRDLFRVYAAPEGGVVALQGLTLEVQECEICVVLGPSGSGKSTLLRMLAALDHRRPGACACTP